jgi:hypothetical protein
MIKTFAKYLKRVREQEEDVGRMEDELVESQASQTNIPSSSSTSCSPPPHRPTTTTSKTTDTPSPNKKLKINHRNQSLLSKCEEDVVMNICEFIASNEISNLMLINHHWYQTLQNRLFVMSDNNEEDDDISINDFYEYPRREIYETIIKEEVNPFESDSIPINTSQEKYSNYYPQTTKFFKRHSSDYSNEKDTVVIDLTEEDEDENNVSAMNTTDLPNENEISLITSPVPSSPKESEDDDESIINSLDDIVTYYSSQMVIDEPPTEVDAEEEQRNRILFEQLNSGITVLYFNKKFMIQLTEPFWTLIIQNETYELDYHKPIFTVHNFLKILSFFRNNKWKLTRMKLTLIQLYHLLKPTSCVFFSSQRQVEYFLSEVKSLLFPVHHKVGNLTFLLLKHIQEYKHWYEDSAHLLPDWVLSSETFECAESAAQMKKVIRHSASSKSKNNNLVQNPENNVHLVHEFQIYFNYSHEYEHSELLNYWLDQLSVTSFSYNDGFYYGNVNAHGKPDGYGSWVCSDKSGRFDGYWVNGIKSGDGKYTSDTFIYVGEWAEDDLNGNGELEFIGGENQGCYYVGEFENGIKHGYGMQYYLKPNTSEDNEEEDDRIMVDENGRRFHAWYRGAWNNDYRTGKGEYRSKNVYKYGTWKDELFSVSID